MGISDLNQKKILKKEFLVGYLKNEWEVYLHGWQDWKRETRDWTDITQWFTGLSLTGLHRRNIRERYGVEIEVNPYSKAISHVSALV